MLDSLTTEWSRPYKIVRVLQALAMDVPKRLRRERLLAMVGALEKANIEARLADGSPLDTEESPGIEAKVRMRRKAETRTSSNELGYEVIQAIPSGGMGICYKVRAPDDGSIRFLKKVPISGTHADALQRELEIYSKLERAQAEHVLRFIDHPRDDRAIGLVMEYADGGTLEEYREGHHDLSTTEVKSIASAILKGLAELHSLDIVHRDLKPANVLRTGGVWKLADFGISKNLARLISSGRTFQRIGTPGYAPPEQWAGREAHASADVYAFGKLLVFLLSGETDVDYIFDHPQWADLVRRCTRFEPDARASLSEIEEQMGRF